MDYESVREVISADPRIGSAWLNVGHGNYCGVGGYCFPKDLDAFIATLKSLHIEEGAELLLSDKEFNNKLLESQGLTFEGVSQHHDANELLIKMKKSRA